MQGVLIIELLFPHARLQPAVDAFTLPLTSIEVSRSPEDTKEYGRFEPGLNHGGVRGKAVVADKG